MSFEEMVVALVAIGCGTAIVGHVVAAIKAVAIAWAQGRSGTLPAHGSRQAALQQKNDEMARLLQSSTDVVLTFEATLQRLEARLERLERNALSDGAAPNTIASGAYPAPVTRTAAETGLVAGAR
jgi:hypothetical protein